VVVLSVNVQAGAAAAWFTVNVWVAMVAVPLRPPPVLAATVSATDPFPLPCVGETEIHEALLDAVHEHPAPADTLTMPLSPAAGAEVLVGLIV